MKRRQSRQEDIKEILKPLVKQCIREALFEEGVLSSIITEVIRGTQTPILEAKQKQPRQQRQPAQPAQPKQNGQQRLQKQKKALLDSIGNSSYGGVDLFEGTQPLSQAGSPNNGVSARSPLADMDPSDPGVDIASIPGMGNWGKLI